MQLGRKELEEASAPELGQKQNFDLHSNVASPPITPQLFKSRNIPIP